MTADKARRYVLECCRGEQTTPQALLVVEHAIAELLSGQHDVELAEALDAGGHLPASPVDAEKSWTMTPESIVSSGLDDACVRLYALADLTQRDYRKPLEGIGAAARAMGWKPDKAGVHVKHLVAAGLIKLVRGPDRTRAVLEVVHNPARARYSRGADVPAVPARYRRPSKAAAKFAPPTVTRSSGDPEADRVPPEGSADCDPIVGGQPDCDPIVGGQPTVTRSSGHRSPDHRVTDTRSSGDSRPSLLDLSPKVSEAWPRANEGDWQQQPATLKPPEDRDSTHEAADGSTASSLTDVGDLGAASRHDQQRHNETVDTVPLWPWPAPEDCECGGPDQPSCEDLAPAELDRLAAIESDNPHHGKEQVA